MSKNQLDSGAILFRQYRTMQGAQLTCMVRSCFYQKGGSRERLPPFLQTGSCVGFVLFAEGEKALTGVIARHKGAGADRERKVACEFFF